MCSIGFPVDLARIGMHAWSEVLLICTSNGTVRMVWPVARGCFTSYGTSYGTSRICNCIVEWILGLNSLSLNLLLNLTS